MSSPLPITTARLLLRAATEDDAGDLLAYYGDPEVARYLPFDVLDEAGVADRLARFIRNATEPEPEDGDAVVSAMIELDANLVGDVMLRRKPGPMRSMAEVGWVLNPAWSGRGIATEAARAMIDLAFGELGCHRVMANLDPRNLASARLCERLGMTREAHLRRDWFGKGEWSDTSIYGLLREEWSARPDAG
ncbi:GNAT family protein [soil metagenome]